MTSVSLIVNGKPVVADVEPRRHLADFLREDILLTGTHIGCESGVCGACTVLIDGQPSRSCITFTVALDGAEITTIEGFEEDPLMVELRKAFSAEHGLQCGYCTPGMLVMAHDIVRRLTAIDEARLRTELSGNQCRCTGYMGIVNAVQRVMDTHGGASLPEPPQRKREHAPPPPPPADLPTLPPEQPGHPGVGGAMTRIEQTIVVHHPRDVVWASLADVRRMVSCMPGASLTEESDGTTIKGQIRIKAGPMSTTFSGVGAIDRDDSHFRGVLSGGGNDSRGNSRANGNIRYRLSETNQGASTNIDLEIEYMLTGPLAQFSRGGIIREIVGRLVDSFAQNLQNSMDTGRIPDADAELNAAKILISVIWGWLRRFVTPRS